MKKIILIVLGIIIFACLIFGLASFKVFEISGSSMEPTFSNGERLLISKNAYSFENPKRGDIVLLKNDGKVLVKRIIASGNQYLEIKEGKVLLNGEEQKEPYINTNYTFGNQRMLVADNEYFVMGDNREANQSIDSREIGPVSRNEIIGKVIYSISGGFEKIENPYKK